MVVWLNFNALSHGSYDDDWHATQFSTRSRSQIRANIFNITSFLLVVAYISAWSCVYKFWAPLSSKKVSFTDYNETNLKINYEITDCGALIFKNINKFLPCLYSNWLSHEWGILWCFDCFLKNILIENALN